MPCQTNLLIPARAYRTQLVQPSLRSGLLSVHRSVKGPSSLRASKMGPSQKCAPERLCSSALSLSTSQNLIFPLSTIPPPRMIFNETVAATTAAEQINGDGDKIHGRHATPPSHHIEYREISVVWGRWTESKCVPRRLKRYGMIWFQRGKGVTDLPDHVLYTDLSKL